MIVLDTHAFIWAMQGDKKLGAKARRMIEQAAGKAEVLVPSICLWEIALVEKREQVVFPGGALRWMQKAFDGTGIRSAPLEPEIAVDSVTMQWEHKDPADRIIVATARYWQAPLMTIDRKIRTYAANGHFEVIVAGY